MLDFSQPTRPAEIFIFFSFPSLVRRYSVGLLMLSALHASLWDRTVSIFCHHYWFQNGIVKFWVSAVQRTIVYYLNQPSSKPVSRPITPATTAPMPIAPFQSLFSDLLIYQLWKRSVESTQIKASIISCCVAVIYYLFKIKFNDHDFLNKKRIRGNLIRTLNRKNENLFPKLRLATGSPFYLGMSIYVWALAELS